MTVILFLSGCSASGPAFKPYGEFSSEKGLVYIYRQAQFQGSAIAYTVKANGVAIGTLKNGGYLTYLADLGPVIFSAKTEAKAEVTIDIKAGETYYIKGDIGMGFFVGHPKLSVVHKITGESEIVHCKLDQ